jgi:signal transduction histidine kinase/streptogramin lyase
MHLAKNLAGILFLGYGLLVGTVFGQTRLYTPYTKADGLPSDYVMCIYQSPGGLMWFGTERGAVSYDGERFTRYTTDDGLPHNLIFGMLEDTRGRTWFATQSNSLRYLQHNEIHTFLDSTGSKMPVSSIGTDRNGRVFFRFHDGMGVLNGVDYEFHSVDLPVSKESNMIQLMDGRLLLTDSRHILATRLDSGSDLRFDTLHVFDRHSNYASFQQASDSSLYISNNADLLHYRIQDGTLHLLSSKETPFSTTMEVLPGAQPIRVILGGRYSGLSMVQDGVFTQIITSQGSQNNHISAQLVDYEGNLWVAHFGQGVQKITSWNAVIFDQESGIRERNVWRVATRDDRIFAMSVAGIQAISKNVVRLDHPFNLKYSTVRGVQFGRNQAYIATMSTLRAHEYDAATNTVGKGLDYLDMGDGVNDILLGHDESLWIATAGQRLFRLMTDGEVRKYPVVNGVERLVRSGTAMWWLTSDNGAYRFTADSDSLIHLSKENGQLPSNSVWSLFEDENGILIGTSAGLVRIPPKGPPSTYQASNGLIGTEVIGIFPVQNGHAAIPSYWVITRNHIHQLIGEDLIKTASLAPISNEMTGTHWLIPAEDGKSMILATASGVLVYDLTKTGREIPSPKVALQSVLINSEAVQIRNNGPIQHQSASIALDVTFSGLTFLKERDTRFTYRLVGLDDSWSNPQMIRSVRYANLPPGSYEFQVKAVNVDGIESEQPATIRIRVVPPFWMHPLFVFVMIAALSGLFLFGVRWRLNAIKLEIVKRNEQRQFEAIQRIGASISHDIKNTVFSLNLLARNLEKRFDNPEFRKDAIETIESSLTYLSTLVSRLQKQPTNLSVSMVDVDLDEMVQTIQKRLSVITERDITVQIPAGFTITSDPEIVERIMENLIQNAIDATSASDSIRVSARKESNASIVCVTDTGKGMSEQFIRDQLFKPFQSTKTKGIGIGLYTCKELVELLNGHLTVESELGKGTTFCIRFVS